MGASATSGFPPLPSTPPPMAPQNPIEAFNLFKKRNGLDYAAIHNSLARCETGPLRGLLRSQDDTTGNTLLHYAVRSLARTPDNLKALVALVNFMIDKGSDIDAQNDMEESVLHACTDEGHVEVSKQQSHDDCDDYLGTPHIYKSVGGPEYHHPPFDHLVSRDLRQMCFLMNASIA